MPRHGSRPPRDPRHPRSDGGRAGRRPPRTDRDRRRRELGQNLLVRPEAISAIVACAAPAPGQLILDLGAGRGALTAALRERGARVRAVELDPAFAAELTRRYAHDADVEVVRGDALCVPWPATPFRVVANPPYGRGTAVLRRLLAADAPLIDATVLLQWEAARRLGAPGRTGALSLSWAPWYELERVGTRIDRRCFRPVPAVDGGLLQVRPRAVPWLSPAHRPGWARFVDEVFAAPGGTAAERLAATHGASRARRAAREAEVEVVRPPSRLEVSAWVALYRALR